MQLIKNLQKGDYFNEGKVFFPLFNKEIEIDVDFDVDIDYAEQCAEHMANMSDSLVDKFCERAIKYYEYVQSEYEDFYDVFGQFIKMDMSLKFNGRDILQYIEPRQVIITKPLQPVPAFTLDCGCGWEPEHGLELVVRGEQVLCVGDCMGLTPWEDDDEYESVF